MSNPLAETSPSLGTECPVSCPRAARLLRQCVRFAPQNEGVGEHGEAALRVEGYVESCAHRDLPHRLLRSASRCTQCSTQYAVHLGSCRTTDRDECSQVGDRKSQRWSGWLCHLIDCGMAYGVGKILIGRSYWSTFLVRLPWKERPR